MKILLAGGGTGGHVFPAIAVARALSELGANPLFVGAERGLEAKAVPDAGYKLHLLPLEPMKGGGVRRAMRGGMIAATGVAAATRLLRRERPAVVLGVGGYAAGPTCLAAAVLGIPLAVLEPNAVPGFTNRLLAPFATRAYVTWPGAGRRFRSVRVLGVPVRPGFMVTPYVARRRIVVFGGSQGARILNETLPGAFAELRAQGLEFSLLHQTGRSAAPAAAERYAALGIPVQVTPFVDDVPAELARASLVLGRAGASTVAELLAAGRPSVLVPFAAAADDHQTANARLVEAAGAGVHVAERELGRLAVVLRELFSEPARLSGMANAAASIARPNAAHAIAVDLLSLAR